MTGGYRLAGSPAFTAREEPTFLYRRVPIVTRWPRLPPLPQQIEHLRREHNIAIFATLGLLDPDDLLRAVEVLDLQAHHLARAQAAAVAQTKHHARLEAAGDRQQPARLVRAYHLRNLLRLAQVIDLGGKI